MIKDQVIILNMDEKIKKKRIIDLVINNGSLMENISISETTENGTNILNLTIVDLDIDTNLNLGILSGNLRNVFTFSLLSTNLDNSTRTQYEAIGQLKVVAPLDFESTPNYTLVLFAFDTKNLAKITVIVYLISQNTKAPYFNLMPGFTSYEYRVIERTPYSILNGPPVSCYKLRICRFYRNYCFEIYFSMLINSISNHSKVFLEYSSYHSST
jgi:hypothetical protein